MLFALNINELYMYFLKYMDGLGIIHIIFNDQINKQVRRIILPNY